MQWLLIETLNNRNKSNWYIKHLIIVLHKLGFQFNADPITLKQCMINKSLHSHL